MDIDDLYELARAMVVAGKNTLRLERSVFERLFRQSFDRFERFQHPLPGDHFCCLGVKIIARD